MGMDGTLSTSGSPTLQPITITSERTDTRPSTPICSIGQSATLAVGIDFYGGNRMASTEAIPFSSTKANSIYDSRMAAHLLAEGLRSIKCLRPICAALHEARN